MTISKKSAVTLGLILFLIAGTGVGYLWWERHSHGPDEHTVHAPTQYTCPMHPFIIKDKPGACPICGMALVPVRQGGDETGNDKDQELLAHLSLSPTQRLMANVATAPAKRQPFNREIDAVGIVAYDQERQAGVTAWVAGRIDRLYVSRVGDRVSRERPIAEIYSPELVSAQQEYLLALKSRDVLKDSPVDAISQGGEGLVSSARQKLKLMGVRDHQIAALERGGHVATRIPVYTPFNGVVIEKLVLEGQYVKVGDPLFSIADLSRVWVDVEVYENEFPAIKIGQRVEFSSQSYPGATFVGRVSFIYPFLDPKTRTVKVRVELPNPGGKLKPDMFVRGVIKAPQGTVLTIPVTAVLDTGKRRVVWVETEPGIFAPRDVETGARSGDLIRVISGLREGEMVAVSGGYLIDSEAQLKGGMAGGHEGHGAAASPEKPDDMSMDDMEM